MSYSYLEHTADVRFRVEANSWKQIFEDAAYALTNTIADISGLKPEQKKEITVVSNSIPELLHKWLEEILLETAIFQNIMVSCNIKEINVNTFELKAEIGVIKINKIPVERLKTEVKAVTYNEYIVKEENGKKYCEITLDI